MVGIYAVYRALKRCKSTLTSYKGGPLILGFGGAFTDAAAIQLENLGAPLDAQVLRDYFGPAGARFSATLALTSG